MKQDNRAYAKRLMVHYFQIVWPGGGFPWHSDNQVELELLVDAIIDAAAEETAKRLVGMLREARGE